MISRLLAAVCAAIAVAVPAIAQACPSCAGRNEGGVGRIIVLGIMIILPFAIAGVVYRVIRGANAQAERLERVP